MEQHCHYTSAALYMLNLVSSPQCEALYILNASGMQQCVTIFGSLHTVYDKLDEIGQNLELPLVACHGAQWSSIASGPQLIGNLVAFLQLFITMVMCRAINLVNILLF